MDSLCALEAISHMRVRTLLLFCLLGSLTARLGAVEPATLSAEPPETDLVCLGYLVAGIADERQQHCGLLEWRSRPLWHGFGPYLLGGLRETGSIYLGAGLFYTRSLSPRWKLTVSSGPGYFDDKGDPDLGSRLEFASALEVAYRFKDGRRIALGVGHISNAGAGRVNPGSEYLSLSVQLPVPHR